VFSSHRLFMERRIEDPPIFYYRYTIKEHIGLKLPNRNYATINPQIDSIGTFHVFIRQRTGAIWTVNTGPDETIVDLLLKLNQQHQVPIETHRLSYNNKILKVDLTLSDYNIQSNATLQLIPFENKLINATSIRIHYERNCIILNVNSSFTLTDLCDLIVDNIVANGDTEILRQHKVFSLSAAGKPIMSYSPTQEPISSIGLLDTQRISVVFPHRVMNSKLKCMI
jgi:Ubiquitin family